MVVLEQIYKSSKAITGFLVIVLVFEMIFDNNTTNKMVMLVLFSIIIINAEKFIELLKNAYN